MDTRAFDVIVAGGGPAGVSAAVAAARAGRRVLLLERQGCLGGVWTAGLLSYVFDFDKSGIGWEIIRRLNALVAVDDGDKLAPFVSNEPAMWTRDKAPDGTERSHHICATRRLMAALREVVGKAAAGGCSR